MYVFTAFLNILDFFFFGFVFIGFSPPLVFFSHDLMTIFSVNIWTPFSFLCVHIDYRFLVCGYHELFV